MDRRKFIGGMLKGAAAASVVKAAPVAADTYGTIYRPNEGIGAKVAADGGTRRDNIYIGPNAGRPYNTLIGYECTKVSFSKVKPG